MAIERVSKAILDRVLNLPTEATAYEETGVRRFALSVHAARLTEAPSHHYQVTFNFAEPCDARHEAPLLKPVTLEQTKAGLLRCKDGDCNDFYPTCRGMTDGLA